MNGPMARTGGTVMLELRLEGSCLRNRIYTMGTKWKRDLRKVY
jgi:hypothetical protein